MTEFIFSENLKPKFYSVKNGIRQNWTTKYSKNKSAFSKFSVEAELIFCDETRDDRQSFSYSLSIRNKNKSDYAPEGLFLDLGIDTYMVSPQDWNEKFFPTFFRCEKTHFYGYFMSPKGEILSVFSPNPICSYKLDYNIHNMSPGNRIHGVAAALLTDCKQPSHHPKINSVLKSKEKMEFQFYFDKCSSVADFENLMCEKYNIPIFKAQSYTVGLNESFGINVLSKDSYSISITAPDGEVSQNDKALKEGLYTVDITTASGKRASAFLYCRKPWDWYLKQARLQMIEKPPHATTHCESWYGFYSGFLAAKHYPDEKLDGIVDDMFNEMMPYMFDFENYKPKLLAKRLQNTGALISLLTDRYEVDPQNRGRDIFVASKFADWLIGFQHKNGGLYRDDVNYTSVIYPVKSLLELWEIEKELGKSDDYYKKAAVRHYEAAKRGADNLIDNLENMDVKGDSTLEGGVLTCSVLQIALFALTLPKAQRKKYIDAAEYILSIQSCLENMVTPDCRVNGTMIRYWEAQYDVLIRNNFIASPHGWSAWLIYANYYIYLLSGKEEYLIRFMNGMGACAQLMDINGNLHWGFCVDPMINVELRLFPDKRREVKDAYNSVKLSSKAYKGIFLKDVIGEEYIDMISGWYRTSKKQKVTGGHFECPLYTEYETIQVDKQGGCCDNDVHEVFKCMEEVVLKKAFILEKDNGEFLTYGCRVQRCDDFLAVETETDITQIHFNLKNNYSVKCRNLNFDVKNQPVFIKI